MLPDQSPETTAEPDMPRCPDHPNAGIDVVPMETPPPTGMWFDVVCETCKLKMGTVRV